MNKRIKELAEQAEKYADDNFKGQPTYSEAYDSKFAELIVRECAAQVDHVYKQGGGTYKEAILKHFGFKSI